MTTTTHRSTLERTPTRGADDSAARRSADHGGKPALGRPLVFVIMLLLATAAVLYLLIAGPLLPMGLSIALAAGVVCFVLLTWIIAGPRL